MKKRAPKAKLSKARAAAKRLRVTTKSKKKSTRSPEQKKRAQTKELVRRWFEILWNQRNPGIVKELLDPAGVGETEGGTIRGHGEFLEKLHAPLIGAFGKLRVTLDDIIAEGESAAVRWTFVAQHTGDTLGVPATNRWVKVSGMSWVRAKDGRLIAGWDRWNSAGLINYLTNGATSATVCEHVEPV